MLYGTNVFSRNNRRTLKPKISTYNRKEQGFDYFFAHTRGGASSLSRSDIIQANLLYKCPYAYGKYHGYLLVERKAKCMSLDHQLGFKM